MVTVPAATADDIGASGSKNRTASRVLSFIVVSPEMGRLRL
jgi:hypothetical protein